jgi:K+-transporting ATPase ATPase C chain
VARARNLALAPVETLIKTHERGRLFGLIGERRINVLELNLALDQMR